MIEVGLTGDDALVQRLRSLPARIHDRLLATMQRLGIDLRERVVANLSGAVLHRRSGRLAAAQRVEITDEDTWIGFKVGFDPATVPYGAIHEYGGTTRAHLIEAKNRKALAFNLGGRLIFAKRVQHPGSKIPERSFLRSALADFAPQALAALTAIADDEAAK
jgi:phage gpG-like protein